MNKRPELSNYYSYTCLVTFDDVILTPSLCKYKYNVHRSICLFSDHPFVNKASNTLDC